MNIMTTIGNFLIYSARSPENNPNININIFFSTILLLFQAVVFLFGTDVDEIWDLL